MYIFSLKILTYIILVLFTETLLLRAIYRRIKKDEPNHYFMLSQLKDSDSLRFFTKYFIFRSLPLFLVSLLNYKLFPFLLTTPVNILALNISLGFLEILGTNLKGYRKFLGTNLAYLHLFSALFISLIPLLSWLIYPNVSELLPQAQGIIDNIWSALIIYAIVAIFFYPYENNSQEDKFNSLRLDFLYRTSKYSSFVDEESSKFNADTLLIKSIIYFESKQRPFILRLIEKMTVCIFHVELSQGIMQFKTKEVIDDKMSIQLAIKKYFKDTNDITDNPALIMERIEQYNFSKKYVSEIINIYYKMKRL